MKITSLIMGIMSVAGMFLGFIPCLGAFNWVNIPFAVLGLIISIIARGKDDASTKNTALAGIIMCAVAIAFGGVRLFLGAGVV